MNQTPLMLYSIPPGERRFGYAVHVVHPYQRMALSPKVPVTPEFRAEINAWMAEFFGYESMLKPGEMIVSDYAAAVYVRADELHLLRNL